MRVVIVVRTLGIFGKCDPCGGVEKFVTTAHQLGGLYKGIEGEPKGNIFGTMHVHVGRGAGRGQRSISHKETS